VTKSRTSSNHEPARTRRKRTPSPPRRPVTRSQTSGRPPHRRRGSDGIDVKPPSVKTEVATPENTPSSACSVEPEVSPSTDECTTHSQPPSAQYTFLGEASLIVDRRGPRSRATLPVPVPNLTKKSRGRRVPTKPTAEKDGTQKANRLYVCKVEDCGKCFNRGEHLKRHIRSIHTHEKR